jgi:hypothetical protein
MTRKLAMKTALLMAIITTLGAPTWAHKFPLTASARVPAATGEVVTGKDRNGNTELTMTVRFLAKAQNLTPPSNTYVVWFAMEGMPPENEGELKIDKNLRGDFKTHTPWKNFDIFVTAESDPMIQMPSDDGVLRTKIRE